EALASVINATLLAGGLSFADPRLLGGIGVGTAAPMDLNSGTVSPVNIPGWRLFPLRDRLIARYGVPVGMIGDAVAVAIGEHWKGAARGNDNVLGMVVSTGVGGGLILGGRVLPGATGNAGHIGHASVDPEGPVCVCGGIGCLEAIASGRSLAAWARDSGFTGGDGSASAVADAAALGDRIALAAFRRAGAALGMAIAGAVTLLDLDLVVIGGGVASAGALLFEPLDAAYRRYAALGFAAAPRVVPATLGGTAGLIGAAAVVLSPANYWPGSIGSVGDGPGGVGPG
ncbi:MAG: ROK family protein, partial [Nakamurella sp.]